jgi:DNA-binding FrmR family transcriptional regulator
MLSRQLEDVIEDLEHMVEDGDPIAEVRQQAIAVTNARMALARGFLEAMN